MKAEVLAALLMLHPPHQPFNARNAPAAPDYSQASAWGALPSRENATDIAPAGEKIANQANAPADVFFLHPTTFFSSGEWNQPIDDVQTNAFTDFTSLRGQASAFNGCCRVYAPRYRQRTFSAYLKYDNNSRKAEQLAYDDVKRAFRYYLAHYNHGRPFIIASHSQGSLHALRLVSEVIDGTPISQRMVAAYILGDWIPLSWFANLKTVRPCERSDDTECVLTWNTLAEGANAQTQRDNSLAHSPFDRAVVKNQFVCTNPLSWSRGPALARAGLNLGGWVPGPEEVAPPANPALVSARCENGALFVSEPRGAQYQAAALPGGNYHTYDVAFFYMNVRRNAEARVSAYWAHH